MKITHLPPAMRKAAMGLIIAAGSLAAGFLLSRVGLFKTLEWKIYDLELRGLARPLGEPSKDIVMVKIDDLSVQRMAENDFGRFPWPRDAYVVLLDYFVRARPKVVTFDILFLEEDKNTFAGKTGADADKEFAEATERSRNVVHAIDVNDTATVADDTPASTGFSDNPAIEEHLSVTLPFSTLAQSSRMLGHTFMVFDADGPIRRAVPLIRHGKSVYPSLALATAMLALNVAPADVSINNDGLHLGSHLIPLLDVDQEYVTKIQARHIQIPYKAGAYADEQRTITTYRSYRFWDLFLSELQLKEGKPPEIDPAIFRDKIVFVGTTAAGLHDLFQTPYGDTGKMPGMQIHASVVDAILSDTFIRAAAPSYSVALPVLSALFVGILGVFAGFWWAILGALVVVGIDAAVIATLFRHGIWLHSVPTASTLVFAQFGSVAYKYFIEDRAKRQIHGLFSRFVSPEVVKELVKDPTKAKLGGRRRHMSVLFSDIRGFTTLSEASDPESILHQLNDYFSHMVELLFLHKGTLDKFVGDMIMALFNAPLDDPDHADHAVQMGLAMLRELEVLNKKWEAEGRPRFDIGIGINTGEMIAGNLGSEKTLSYTVIGDNVNLGSRLESLNKEYKSHIIISDATLRELKGSYNVTPLGSVKVKGKTREVAIYEVRAT